jgi:hypothetical protein
MAIRDRIERGENSPKRPGNLRVVNLAMLV